MQALTRVDDEKERVTMASCLNSELQFFKYMQMIESESATARSEHDLDRGQEMHANRGFTNSKADKDLTSSAHEHLGAALSPSCSPGTANTADRSETINGAASNSRYEAQKRRDWNTFGQFLRNHSSPLTLSSCNGAHVLDFLRYLDQFGKTKVHASDCSFFGLAKPPAQCPCPLRQAWGSLDALIGRLRAAFEENGGVPEANPFAARIVRQHLREVREHQARARGIAYQKKKRKRSSNSADQQLQTPSHAPAGSGVVASISQQQIMNSS